MARVSANDPNLYQVEIFPGGGQGGKFAACLVADEQGFSHEACMDGYICYEQGRVVFICSCKCHADQGPSGWLGLL